jgi:tRNA(His) 5'-end guanylyltransferase
MRQECHQRSHLRLGAAQRAEILFRMRGVALNEAAVIAQRGFIRVALRKPVRPVIEIDPVARYVHESLKKNK